MNQNDEWYTPDYIIDKARDTLGSIDLDPFSNESAQRRIKAHDYYTINNDAFAHHWRGRVWINPPYSNKIIKKAIKRLVRYYEYGSISAFICLTNSATDTQWNRPLQKYTQVYTNGRIRFIQANGQIKNAGSRGQCFTYAGPDISKFLSNFTDDNFCWAPNIPSSASRIDKEQLLL